MSWLPDEVDYSDSPLDEIEEPPDWLSKATTKMFCDAVRMASSVEEWKKGVDMARFAFTDDASATKTTSNSPHEAIKFCLDRIENGTHPDAGDIAWKTDRYNKVRIDQCTTLIYVSRTLPALARVQPLADLRQHRWTSDADAEARFRSQVWRDMVTKSSYICRTKALLFILLCAPRWELNSLVKTVFEFDNRYWYDSVASNCLASYAKMHDMEMRKVVKIFDTLAELLHGQDELMEVDC